MSKYIYVLYSSKTSPSGRALGTSLAENLPTDKGIAVEFGTERRLSLVVRKRGEVPNMIINFGGLNSSIKLYGVPAHISAGKPLTVLNHPAKVLGSSNKRAFRIEMQKKGVPSPELWIGNPATIPTEKYPVIGRTTTHTKGHGLWFCNTRAEAQNAYASGATHFIKFIKNTQEFRVHVVASSVKKEKDSTDYLSIKTSKKYKDNPTEKDKVVKNYDNGWTFVSPKDVDRSILVKVRETAKKALSILDMDFGAVDVMYSNDDGNCYVLEVNSSPCLTDNTADTLSRYTVAMFRLLGITEPFAKKAMPVIENTIKPTIKIPIAPNKKMVSDIDLVRKLLNRVGV